MTGMVLTDIIGKLKGMPDALSKTVPTWIAVMNRLLFPEPEDAHALCVLPQITSESERLQIECRLNDFVESLRVSRKLLRFEGALRVTLNGSIGSQARC